MSDSNNILSSSTESPVILAIEPKDRARLIMSALQDRDEESSILEVLDVQSNIYDAVANKVGFVSYKDLAKQGQNRSFFKPDPGSNDKSNGVYVNLKGAYGEAIILKHLRESVSAGLGTVLYEPALQGTLLLDKIAGTSISNSFNGKTPDLLMVVPRTETRVGGGILVTSGTLKNVVDGDSLKNISSRRPAPLVSLTYQNTNLISPIEVTTSNKYSNILKKVEKFSAYRNLSNSRTSYVPVLVMDKDVFNTFNKERKVELVDKIKKFGGVISLSKGLSITAELKAIKAANWLEDGMNGRDISSIQENESPVLSTQSIDSEQTSNDSISGVSTASASSIKSLSATAAENAEKITSQLLPQESLASRRYQAIKVLLEEEGIKEEKTSDWAKAILYTASETGLEKRDVQDIVEQIPGMQATQAAKLVNGLSQQQL